MTKRFEFRRHSIKDGPTPAMIGPRGYALARRVGELQLRGRRFDAFFASSYFRTHQTLVAFAEGAGDFALKLAPPWPPIYADSDDVRALWRACAVAERRGDDMVDAAQTHDDALVRTLRREIAGLFLDWAASLHDGVNALVIGHSPHLEFLYCGLSGDEAPSFYGMRGLKECQGLRIVLDGGAVSLDRSSPDLNPAPIRAALFP